VGPTCFYFEGGLAAGRLAEPDRRRHRRYRRGGPEGGSFILAEQDAWASGPRIAGRTRVPYAERDGMYWGPPADDDEAIAELERQRARAERYFVVAFPHLWYLEHYRGLNAWLTRNARERVRNDRVAIFELASAAPP
jgi:hypothetical protein